MRLLAAGLMSIRVLIESAAFANAGTDSTSLLDGPVIGYVAQSSIPELRAIIGVPGAAVFSDPLPLPGNVRHIYMPPGQDYALLERVDEDPAVLLLSGSSADQVISLSGAVA